MVGQLAADAGHAPGGHQYQETSGQGHLGGQTGTLVSDRILGDLDQDRITGLEGQLDTSGLPLQTGGVPVDLTRVENAVAGLSDIDKGRLHAGQDVLNPPQVDIADRGDLLYVGDIVLHQDVVFNDRNLCVLFLFTHHHEPVDTLTAGQEVLLHQLGLARTLATVVAPTLLLGLQAGGSFDIRDFVDVLLLAGAPGTAGLLTFGIGRLGAAPPPASTGQPPFFLLFAFMVPRAAIATRTGLLGFLLMGALALAATTSPGRAGGDLLLTLVLIVDEGDALVVEVLLDLLHLIGGTTLLGVEPSRPAGSRFGTLLVLCQRLMVDGITGAAAPGPAG